MRCTVIIYRCYSGQWLWWFRTTQWLPKFLSTRWDLSTPAASPPKLLPRINSARSSCHLSITTTMVWELSSRYWRRPAIWKLNIRSREKMCLYWGPSMTSTYQRWLSLLLQSKDFTKLKIWSIAQSGICEHVTFFRKSTLPMIAWLENMNLVNISHHTPFILIGTRLIIFWTL